MQQQTRVDQEATRRLLVQVADQIDLVPREWRDLVSQINGDQLIDISRKQAAVIERLHRDIVTRTMLDELDESDALNEWERDFVGNVVDQGFISAKQAHIVRKIHAERIG